MHSIIYQLYGVVANLPEEEPLGTFERSELAEWLIDASQLSQFPFIRGAAARVIDVLEDGLIKSEEKSALLI